MTIWRLQETNKQDMTTNPTKYGSKYKILADKRHDTYK
jgi:hypothetical protein